MTEPIEVEETKDQNVVEPEPQSEQEHPVAVPAWDDDAFED